PRPWSVEDQQRRRVGSPSSVGLITHHADRATVRGRSPSCELVTDVSPPPVVQRRTVDPLHPREDEEASSTRPGHVRHVVLEVAEDTPPIFFQAMEPFLFSTPGPGRTLADALLHACS